MPLLDFARLPRIVREGGRAYVCRPPSVLTVHLAVSYFWDEIQAARKLHELEPEIPAHALMAGLVDRCLERRGELALVLSTCVEGSTFEDLERELAIPELAQQLVEACTVTSNLPRVVASLDLGSVRLAPSGPDPRDRVVVGLAQIFGLSPCDVVHLPYEATLSISDALPEPEPEQEDGPRAQGGLLSGRIRSARPRS